MKRYVVMDGDIDVCFGPIYGQIILHGQDPSTSTYYDIQIPDT
jgi:hypothetical protein